MPKMTSFVQQHRKVAGNHITWQDKKFSAGFNQDEHIRQLASQPGRHSGNAGRQDVACSAVQLLALLSSIQHDPARQRSVMMRDTPVSHQQSAAGRCLLADSLVFCQARQPGNASLNGKTSEPGCEVQHNSHVLLSDQISASDGEIPAAGDRQQAQAVLPLMAASTSMVLARQTSALNSRVFQYAALSGGITLLVISGNALRQTFFPAQTPNNPLPLDQHEAYLPGLQENNSKVSRYLIRQKVIPNTPLSGPHPEKTMAVQSAIWLVAKQEDYGEKMMGLAREILSSPGYYGSHPQENISGRFAEFVVRQWFFKNALGYGLFEYLVRVIAGDRYPMYYTTSSLIAVLAEKKSHLEEYISETASTENKTAFSQAWDRFINDELPMLSHYADNLFVNNLSVFDDHFAALFTGSLFLHQRGGLQQFKPDDVITTGEALWDIFTGNNTAFNNPGYCLFPAFLFLIAQGKSDLITSEDSRANQLKALEEYITYKKHLIFTNEKINEKMARYSQDLKNWLSRGELASKIVANCPVSELPDLNVLLIDNSVVKAEQRRESAKQSYMSNFDTPCKSAPSSLTEEYRKITDKAANSFAGINRIFLYSALATAEPEEKDFILSDKAVLHFIHLNMKTQKNPGPAYNVYFDTNIYVSVEGANLFSAKLGHEERIYALKVAGQADKKYTVQRLDKDIKKYIDSGILSYKNFGRYSLSGEGEITTYRGEVFHFSFYNGTKIASGQEKGEQLVDAISNLHREQFFDYLYSLGNDKSHLQKFWNVVKHLLPLYDCIEGGIDNDLQQAIPACITDIMLLAPVAGRAAGLAGRFAGGLAKGILTGSAAMRIGGVPHATRLLLREISLPTARELGLLAKSTLRALDPGGELLFLASRKLSKTLIKALQHEGHAEQLAKKLTKYTASQMASDVSAARLTARLPDSELMVSVSKTAEYQGDNIYSVINSETGQPFGPYYHLLEKNGVETLFQMTSTELEKIETVTPQFYDHQSALTHIEPIDPRRFAFSLPDKSGIYVWIEPVSMSRLEAIKIEGKFYKIRREEQRTLVVGKKHDFEFIVFDGHCHLVNPRKVVSANYVQCRIKRAPGDICMHFSEDLEKVLSSSHDKSWQHTEVGELKADEQYPGMFVSPSLKKYIEHRGALFEVRVERITLNGMNGGEKVVILSRDASSIFRFFKKNVITEGYFSRVIPEAHLSSRLENTMEILKINRPSAEAYELINKFPRNRITKDELEVIKNYGGASSDAINEFLLMGMPENYYNGHLRAQAIESIENIRSLLKKLPSFKGVVYRGYIPVREGPSGLSTVNPGDLVATRKFLSTSTTKEIAKGFSSETEGFLYKIHIEKGGHPIMLYTGRIRETEVLIEENTIFRCTATQGRSLEFTEVVNPTAQERQRVRYMTL